MGSPWWGALEGFRAENDSAVIVDGSSVWAVKPSAVE